MIVWAALFVGRAAAAVYYCDPAGSDANDGRSAQTPWRSLAQIGRTTFAPGDQVRFKAGGAWTGQLAPRGSGTAGAPILLDRYGEGPNPRIDGGGQPEGAIKLPNQAFWEIANFEVTNRGPKQGQYVGIKVRNCTGAPLRHIRVRGCMVHDINGYPSGFYPGSGGCAKGGARSHS